MFRRSLPLLVLVLACNLLPSPARAQTSEVAVKAEFVPRFARYVRWPASAAPKGGEPFVLCIIGNDPFKGLIDRAARAQSVDGRRILVRRISTASNAGTCHVAFIGGTASRPAGQLLAAIGTKPVLTVTDSSQGGQRGIVHFSIVSGRVRFFIDQAAAEQRGMEVSSRLLALAVGVRQ